MVGQNDEELSSTEIQFRGRFKISSRWKRRRGKSQPEKPGGRKSRKNSGRNWLGWAL